MPRARLLALVARYPHPRALARRASNGSLFMGLRQLEAGGYVRRHQGLYRLTRRGKRELATTRALVNLVGRSLR